MPVPYTFRRALPVWQEGRATEMNQHISFVCRIPADAVEPVLSLAASCSYVVAVDGEFIACGPARCAHGVYSVDEIPLGRYMTGAERVLSVRVAGYYVRSFQYLRQPSFLCAELCDGETVLFHTDTVGEDALRAYAVTEQYTRVQRYSYQRPFVEHYHLTPDAFAYERGEGNAPALPLEVQAEKTFIRREQPYPDYPVISPRGKIAEGVVRYGEPERTWHDRSLTGAGGVTDGFAEDTLDVYSYREVAAMRFSRTAEFFCRPAQTVSLSADGYADIDLGSEYAGILEFTLESPAGCELFILFDEFFDENGGLDPFRMSTCNVLYYRTEGGCVHIHTTEVYAMRAVRLVVRHGEATVRGFKMYKVGYPSSGIHARYTGGDEGLQKIFDAAVETFAANAADILTDCPTRERAGWLGDSFFTGRVEKLLSGSSSVEKAFLENYILCDPAAVAEKVPRGMVPMCYPADFWNDSYIPNYGMWFVLELEEYAARSGDRDLIDRAREKVYGLVGWFRQYENDLGLLEKLPGWVFVEWSRANDLVQDVNFPSNMLYARMLETVGRLYDDPVAAARADAIRGTVRRLSYLPEKDFFCDNLVWRDGTLMPSGECTETCQYYAFFTGVATPHAYPTLWERLCTEFGPDRQRAGLYPEIAPSNVIFGNYLRLELLSLSGMHEQVLREMHGYFLYMAEKTGTLWEHVGHGASCNHGMASHVLVWLSRAGYLLREA